MATSGQLVEAMAGALNIPVATVALYDRALSEAGIRTKGGRGRSAAKMTSRDAASLLIAIMASPITGPSISGAIEHYRVYAGLVARSGVAGPVREGRNLLQKFIAANVAYSPLALATLLDGGAELLKNRTWLRETSGGFDLRPLKLPSLKALEAGHTAVEGIAAVLDDWQNDTLFNAIEPMDDYRRLWVQHRGLEVKFIAPIAKVAIGIETRGWYEVVSYYAPSQPDRPVEQYGQVRTVGSGVLSRIAYALSHERGGADVDGVL